MKVFSTKSVLTLAALLLALCLGADASKKDYKKEVHIIGQNDPVYFCPEGFTLLNEHTCERTLFEPLQERCNIGEEHEGVCLKKDTPVYSCPEGYIPFDHSDKGTKGKNNYGSFTQQCIKIERSSFESICLDGSVPTARGCPKKQLVPVVLTCPLDSEHTFSHKKSSNLDCIDYKAVSPVRSCMSGFTLVGTQCEGIETVPCIKAEPVLLQVEEKGKSGGKYEEGKGGHHHHHHHHDKGKKNDIPAKVETCENKIVVPSREECPAGAIQTRSTTLYSKSHGSHSHGHGGHHHHAHHHNHHHGSSHGKDVETSLVCVVPESVPLVPYCPIADGKIDENNLTCSIDTFQAPESRCPAGYDTCGGKGKGDFDSCCRVDYKSPQPYCSDSSALQDGYCLSTHPIDYTCPFGYQRNGNTCFAEERAPVKVEYTVKLESFAEPEEEKKKIRGAHLPHSYHAPHTHHHHHHTHHGHVHHEKGDHHHSHEKGKDN